MTRFLMHALVALVLVGVSAAQGAPTLESIAKPVRAPFDTVARVTATLDGVRRGAGFPGASAGFVLPDGTLGEVVVGFADREKRRALLPGDRLLSASIGKTYVAAVAVALAHEGALDLDAKLADTLGDEAWFARLANGADVTLRQLLLHKSGVPEHVLKPEFWEATRTDPDRQFAPEELVAFILDEPPLFEPGSAFAYADTNYILFAMALERVTGRDWYELLTERVLEPLALTATVPSVGRRIPRLVPGHLEESNGLGWPTTTIRRGEFVIDPQCEWTGGGLTASGADLARWAFALYGGHFLPERALAEMIDGAQPTESQRSPGAYGLGVQVWESELGPVHGHAGWFPGYRSEMGYFADHGISVALQINSDVRSEVGSTRDLLVQLAKVILDR